jgi:predicted P-loop ATPase
VVKTLGYPSTTDPSPREPVELTPPTTEGEGTLWADLTVVRKYDPALFLQTLRAGGPWVPTAIHPDTGGITTRTCSTEDDVREFVTTWNGKRNLYYSPNPAKEDAAKDKKLGKTDIAAIEFLIADLDPHEGEASDAAKKRYLDALKEFTPRPSAVVDSGNGIQVLWRLETPVDLTILSDDERTKAIEDAEARSAAAMAALGSVAGTQNIDRILRLPGTTNLPNKKKREAGRVICQTKLLHFNGVSCRLEDFPGRPAVEVAVEASEDAAIDDEIERLIKDGAPLGERSDAVWKVVHAMLRRGYYEDDIVKVLLDRKKKISDHIYDQPDPESYAHRQFKQGVKKVEFTKGSEHGPPLKTMANIRVALLKMGITSLRYDEFLCNTLVDGMPADWRMGPILDDAVVDRLWGLADERFRLKVSKDMVRTTLTDTSRRHVFHPVRDYLSSLKWDGVERVDKWLSTYGGAKSNEYVDAVGRLWLIAAVRRIRRPGCKFDQMLVLENPEQGNNRSSAMALLAVHEDWFSDDFPLHVRGKEIIESTRGHWIIEASELSGMRKADVEHVKSMLSRQIDRARMAYGHIPDNERRQWVAVGTTNDTDYLRDDTGNRRFWPVRVGRFDLDALRRDRDQIWAEAAALEAKGASIVLDPGLWPRAREEQDQRLELDPWVAAIDTWLGGREGKITTEALWTILNVPGSQRDQAKAVRLKKVMRDHLGWRQNKAQTIKVAGKAVPGWSKGYQHDLITVNRHPDTGLKVDSEHDIEEAYPWMGA